jgi:hypothetical protein
MDDAITGRSNAATRLSDREEGAIPGQICDAEKVQIM